MIRRFFALFRRRDYAVIIARRGERVCNRKPDQVAKYIEKQTILVKGRK